MIGVVRMFIACLRECVASLWDGPAADAENLAEDWRQVGADMERAMGHIDEGLCLVMGRLDG